MYAYPQIQCKKYIYFVAVGERLQNLCVVIDSVGIQTLQGATGKIAQSF